MRRFWHYLKANARSESVHSAIWFDTETDQHENEDGQLEHTLRFGWACYQRTKGAGQWCKPDWWRFATPAEFWQGVACRLRPKVRTHLFCHNSNFDLPVVHAFTLPPKMGAVLHRCVMDAPPTIIDYRLETSQIRILDTLNWWRVPLASLGESIGIDKLHMPATWDDQEAADQYCIRDVEIIRQACLRWWEFLISNDLGGFAPTLAGQSMRTYRHRFMPEKILIDDHTKATALARASYLGGRTEMFRHGRIEGPIYVLDINSMYPSVMHESLFPTRFAGYTERNCELVYSALSPSLAAIGEVDLCTEERLYPCQIDGRLTFPVGRFRAVLAGPELSLAILKGHIRRWHRLALYHRAAIFKDFVEFFYHERLKAKAAGDEVRAYFLKILMNSLYGKFGQRGFVWEECAHTEDPTARIWTEIDAQSGKITHVRQLAGLVQRKSAEGEARESMPAIASFVTSYARRALLRLIESVTWEHALYVDTDSVMTDAAGFERVRSGLDDDRLGAAKLQGQYPYVMLRALKDYDLGGASKVKGIRKSAIWLSDTQIRQEKWSGLSGLLRYGNLDVPTTEPIIKHLKRHYRKGILTPDGRVEPLRLP